MQVKRALAGHLVWVDVRFSDCHLGDAEADVSIAALDLVRNQTAAARLGGLAGVRCEPLLCILLLEHRDASCVSGSLPRSFSRHSGHLRDLICYTSLGAKQWHGRS